MDVMPSTRPVLLLTRPRSGSEAFLNALPQDAQDHVECIISPLMEIEMTGTLPDIGAFDGVIFTSANGVEAFRKHGGRAKSQRAIAVGDQTAQAADALGFRTLTAGGNAERLIAFVKEQGLIGPLLHIRGQIAVGDIAKNLTDASVPTKEAVLYQQVLQPLNAEATAALSQDRQVIAPLFSPRTARHLVAESPDGARYDVAAISRAVADEVPEDVRRTCRIAEHPNRDAMLRLVTEMIAETAPLERPSQDV